MTPEQLEAEALRIAKEAHVKLVMDFTNFQRAMGEAEGLMKQAAKERARIQAEDLKKQAEKHE